MTKSKKFVAVEHAGDRSAYAQVLQKIEQDGVCPFCPKNFTYHTRPILRTGAHWILTENMNPYQGAKHHFLFIHKKHIETPDKISPKAWAELRSHIAWIKKNYTIPGATFFMRFGEPAFTGASVRHLHAQYLSGGRVKKVKDPILAVIGYKK